MLPTQYQAQVFTLKSVLRSMENEENKCMGKIQTFQVYQACIGDVIEPQIQYFQVPKFYREKKAISSR